MEELKIKLENLQCTLTDPVSSEDIRAAWFMVGEIIAEEIVAENARLRKIEYAANAAYNYWAGGDEDLPHRMRELREALGGECPPKVYVNVVEYGVCSYPHEEMEKKGWRFMRIEYHDTNQPYAFLEHHVWMPPTIGSGELEDFITKAIGGE